jgi:hypothetical protein
MPYFTFAWFVFACGPVVMRHETDTYTAWTALTRASPYSKRSKRHCVPARLSVLFVCIRESADSGPDPVTHHDLTGFKEEYSWGPPFNHTRLRGVTSQQRPCATHMKHVPCGVQRSRDSRVDIATGYALDGQGFRIRSSAGTWSFSSPRRPARLWGPPSLLSYGYRGLYPRK